MPEVVLWNTANFDIALTPIEYIQGSTADTNTDTDADTFNL